MMRTKDERASDAANDCPAARAIAAQADVELICHTEHHYSFRGKSGWILNVYPTTLKIIPDAGHCQPPKIKLYSREWELPEVANAIVAAVADRREEVAKSKDTKRDVAVDEFMECGACRSVPDDDPYCEACAHNFSAITGLQGELRKLQQQVAINEGFPGLHPGDESHKFRVVSLGGAKTPSEIAKRIAQAMAEDEFVEVSAAEESPIAGVNYPAFEAGLDAGCAACADPVFSGAAIKRDAAGAPKAWKPERKVHSQAAAKGDAAADDRLKNMKVLDDAAPEAVRESIRAAARYAATHCADQIGAKASATEDYGATKYVRKVRAKSGPGFVMADCYNMLDACGVTRAPTAHAAKKLLYAGLRGKGDELRDLKEARVALDRAIEQVEQELAEQSHQTSSTEA